MLNYLYYIAAIKPPTGLPQTDATETQVQTILNVIFVVLGSVALLMVMIGAFKYVISQGEPQATKSAKNTIMYAFIGLVVALSAWGIVSFALEFIVG